MGKNDKETSQEGRKGRELKEMRRKPWQPIEKHGKKSEMKRSIDLKHPSFDVANKSTAV
jgi:hypothetical protein